MHNNLNWNWIQNFHLVNQKNSVVNFFLVLGLGGKKKFEMRDQWCIVSEHPDAVNTAERV